MVIATGTGWPARRLRTMMSSASGNCAPNFFCRRPRRNFSTSSGSSDAAEQRGASSACSMLPRTIIDGAEGDTSAEHDDIDRELADAERQAGLQHQLVERRPAAAGSRRRWSGRARGATAPARSRGRAGRPAA